MENGDSALLPLQAIRVQSSTVAPIKKKKAVPSSLPWRQNHH